MTDTDKHRVSVEQCARWRQRARRGTPCTSIAEETAFGQSTIAKHTRDGNSCGHDTVGITGVAPVPTAARDYPDAEDIPPAMVAIAETLQDQLDRNYGDTVYFSTGRLTEWMPDNEYQNSRIGSALTAFDTRGVVRGISIEQTNPGATKRQWVAKSRRDATPADRLEADGGTASENESSTEGY